MLKGRREKKCDAYERETIAKRGQKYNLSMLGRSGEVVNVLPLNEAQRCKCTRRRSRKKRRREIKCFLRNTLCMFVSLTVISVNLTRQLVIQLK